MRPTIADAKHRVTVVLTHRGWVGELFRVDERRQIGKVRLKSGTVVVVPLAQLDVRALEASLVDDEMEESHAHGDALNGRQAG